MHLQLKVVAPTPRISHGIWEVPHQRGDEVHEGKASQHISVFLTVVTHHPPSDSMEKNMHENCQFFFPVK